MSGTTQTRTIIRSWRLPILLGLVVLAAGVVIALLQPPATNYLDPGDTGPSGGHALFDLLAARGQHVVSTRVPENAASAGGTSAGNLEILTSPGDLTRAQLTAASRFPGDILLVGPTPAALSAIAPAVVATGQSAGPGVLPPLCNDQSANLAGSVYVGGTVLETGNPRAAACYPSAGGYAMVAYTDKGRTISVLGSGDPLTNQYLASDGDAALALNLLRHARTIYWVAPSPNAVAQATGTGQRSFTSLVPWPVYLIVIQLAIAALLAAAWRARRLGPLVAERLPVIVRASETVEGHGRLYRARRARDRAAAELRQAARDRISRLTGTGTGSRTGTGGETDSAAAVAARTISARTGDSPDDVTALLYGPPPGNDAQLVALAGDLDTLERKVRQS
ncbi:MAG TPA: DUF4350 domain-containing protein [Trebonia sp.]|jgi:hypothetical protein|nr:DUF4350 domain-containing protein [Trebonia sp.]